MSASSSPDDAAAGALPGLRRCAPPDAQGPGECWLRRGGPQDRRGAAGDGAATAQKRSSYDRSVAGHVVFAPPVDLSRFILYSTRTLAPHQQFFRLLRWFLPVALPHLALLLEEPERSIDEPQAKPGLLQFRKSTGEVFGLPASVVGVPVLA